MTGRHEVPLILRGQAAATIVTVGLGLLVLVGGLSVVTYIATGTWWLPGFQKTPPALTSEPFSLGDLIKISLALVAGVGAAVGLVTTYRRQALSEREERAADVLRFDQRFASAAAQLGGATPANRIAGVYAVAALADQYPRHRQQCVDVLCGYLRLPFNPDEDGIATTETTVVTSTQDRTVTERTLPARTPHDLEVRHTIQLVIADHLRDPDSATSWTPMTLNLRGAHLHDATFFSCNFGASEFSDAIFAGDSVFVGAAFARDAVFLGASFAGDAVFLGASFAEDAMFNCATFTGIAWFDDATFTGNAWFSSASFTGNGKFNPAIFSRDADFHQASFNKEARFNHARFNSQANFNSATFTGNAMFNSATFSRDADFHQASFNKEARFNHARFNSQADFNSAGFTGDAMFNSARFNRQANFAGASFTDARFEDSSFTEDAWFTDATFDLCARFVGTTFTGGAWFDGATFANESDRPVWPPPQDDETAT
ncbi:MAG: pentapeptide repeat-containing protein [Nocardioides sp.]